MISYFQHLGERIERAWLEWNYDEEVFSLLAQEALEQDPPTENVEVADIIDWVFATSHTFRQPHRTYLFGEPPVMLFQSARFYVEALFWLSGTTTIHEHSFSGVFAVLSGSSVQQRLRSEFQEDSVNAHRDRLLDHAKQLARSDLFHPFFLKSPLREARAA